MSILQRPLVFVDVETTGLSFARSRIIEVAAIRVEASQITKSFSSLVDPQAELPMFISELTGISRRDLMSAPVFDEIADQLQAVMMDAVFIAHNVRFDYGFLKHEFKRIGAHFSPKLLCTVRLSKALYPDSRSHKLQSLIERCNLQVTERHRAYDDAQAMWQFIQHAQQNFPAPLLDAALKQQIKSPSVPKNLRPDILKDLPEETGIYIFEDDTGSPLYIGKSVNIRKRVLSHFSADHEHESEFKISQRIANIETVITGGELSALLLESKLIKEKQPLYNRQLRRHQKMTLARQRLNDNGFITLEMEDTASIDPATIQDVLAVYTTKGKAREILNQIIKDFRLCPKLMGFEKPHGSCFLYHLKKCDGACTGLESAESYNQRLLAAFDKRRLQAWPFKSAVIIEEISDNGVSHSIIVDQWCVIADVSQQPDCQPVIKLQDKMFDLDTYKILRSYLISKAHRLSIKPLALEQLNSLVMA